MLFNMHLCIEVNTYHLIILHIQDERSRASKWPRITCFHYLCFIWLQHASPYNKSSHWEQKSPFKSRWYKTHLAIWSVSGLCGSTLRHNNKNTYTMELNPYGLRRLKQIFSDQSHQQQIETIFIWAKTIIFITNLSVDYFSQLVD